MGYDGRSCEYLGLWWQIVFTPREITQTFMSVITITIALSIPQVSGISRPGAYPVQYTCPGGYVPAQHPNVPLNGQDDHADHAEVGARRGTLA